MFATSCYYARQINRMPPTHKIEVAILSFTATTLLHVTLGTLLPGGLPLQATLMPAITRGAIAATATLVEAIFRSFIDPLVELAIRALTEDHVGAADMPRPLSSLLRFWLNRISAQPLGFLFVRCLPKSIQQPIRNTFLKTSFIPNNMILAANVSFFVLEQFLPADVSLDKMSIPVIY